MKKNIYVLLLLFCTLSLWAGTKPNVIIVLADDLTARDLPSYGGQNVNTPNIDAFRAEGMLFNNAYCSSAMCVPMRASFYTGLYPARNGADKNGPIGSINSDVQSIVHHLSALDYRVALTGKTHIYPQAQYGFEHLDAFTSAIVGTTADYDVEKLKPFMTRDADSPYCLIIASTLPHAPWTVGDPSQFEINDFVLPPNWVDTKDTRERYRDYLAEVAELDVQFGDVLKAIENVGQKENTLVLFCGEQGAQFAGNKWTLWDQGIKTAFIARLPGIIESNSHSDAIIQYVDVIPTIMDLAGGVPSSALDGSSFANVLKGDTTEHRDYAYALHSNFGEGSPYPIRSIRNKNYKLIWNMTFNADYYQIYVKNDKEYSSWEMEAVFDVEWQNIVDRYEHRPEFELYNIVNDPYELNNLVDDKKYSAVFDELKAELDSWMMTQVDPGAILDGDGSENAWYVNASSGNDNNDGLSPNTSFASIEEAFANRSDRDTIFIGSGTYTISQSLVWDEQLVIIGEDAATTIIQPTETLDVAIATFPIFMNMRNAKNLYRPISEIHQLTLRNANNQSFEGGKGGAIYNNVKMKVYDCIIENNIAGFGGGAIFNGNVLEVYRTVIKGNYAKELGGGIHNVWASSREGTLKVRDCAVIRNSAGHTSKPNDVRGGGISVSLNSSDSYSEPWGRTTIENSTIAYNNVIGNGAGLMLRVLNSAKGGTHNAALRHCTIAYNQSTNNKRGGGLMIPTTGVNITMENNLMMGNFSNADEASYDIVTNTNRTQTIDGVGNIVGVINAEASNGAITFTNSGNNTINVAHTEVLLATTMDSSSSFILPLLKGSSAIDGGEFLDREFPLDQRGIVRDLSPDVGSYEYQVTSPVLFVTEESRGIDIAYSKEKSTCIFSINRAVTGTAYIYDISGKLLYKNTLEGVTQIAFAGLQENSVYILRLESQYGVRTKKIIY